jgi:hypothetical protein
VFFRVRVAKIGKHVTAALLDYNFLFFHS